MTDLSTVFLVYIVLVLIGLGVWLLRIAAPWTGKRRRKLTPASRDDG